MKSLIELQAQIEDLQKQAAVVRTRQYAKAVADIAATMKAFGIPLAEVSKALAKTPGKTGRGRPAKVALPAKRRRKTRASSVQAAKKARKGKRVPIKFKGPEGEAWSGRGKQPVWLRKLVAAGRKPEEFKV
jgi:DNA-binding protein H-NS